ncbi:MAG: MerR family DNA-binding transcriptional regulator [Clostridiaceae bacterium]|jgi:MerR family transcriptional activator of bmr gene|nr:MerR family DNA-binding transcriptional regulator [Clostridiaceae bacterium]
MKKEIFSIGEVAKLKGFTIKALRFYDRIGLLKPFMVDKYSNYRYYHLNQFILLDIIKAARTLDISPNELVPFFRSKDTRGLFQLLKKHREYAVEKIKLLERIIQNIDELERNTAAAEAACSEKSVITRFLPARHVLSMPWDTDKTEEDALFDYSSLYMLAGQLGVLPTYTEGVLLNVCGDQPVPSHVFITVESPVDSDSYIRIPAGKYICVSYSMEDIMEQQLKLNAYLAENQMVPLEVLQVTLMTDFFDEAEHFELQVRVE